MELNAGVDSYRPYSAFVLMVRVLASAVRGLASP